MDDPLKNLPLAELHCHLEATVEPADARALAARNNIDVSRAFNEDGEYLWETFDDFIFVYDLVSQAIQTAQDYYDITYNYYKRMAASGVIYGEIIVSPAHALRFNMSYATMVEAIASAITAAEEQFGIVGRMIITCVRHYGVDDAMKTAKMVYDHPHPLVTGFGIAGDEAHLNFTDYAPAFAIAREAGLRLNAHAGELLGPDSVRDAIEVLGIERIGHGVRALEDPGLVAEIKSRGLTLEVCPTSNVAIGLYPSFALHPVAKLIEAGLKVTLNSDDPAFFGSEIADEYRLCASEHGFTRALLKQMTENAVNAAFCDDATRSQLLTKVSTA